METKKLGYSDMYISRIGLGTWPIGGGGWRGGFGPQDDRDSIATIHRAFDLGINWIDTAPYYGLGHAEEIVGKAIKGRRDKVYIATKCGSVWDEGSNQVYERLKAYSIRREIEKSLRRINTDFIDLYQIHWPEPEEDIEEAWSTIVDLIREGKVRYGGTSNFTISQLKLLRKINPIASLQPRFGMIDRNINERLFRYCAQQNIGIIPYWVLQGGLLTGKFTKERAEHLTEDDWRKGRHYFAEPEISINLEFVEGLRIISERNRKTVAQLAVAWVLYREEVTGVIVGARNPFQLDETVQAADWTLSREDRSEIGRLMNNRSMALRKAQW